MTKNDAKNNARAEDVCDVLGLKRTDRLLQVGDSMEFLKKFVRESWYVEDLEKVGYRHTYDKILVYGSTFDERLIGKLACISEGTIAFFDEDDDRRQQLKDLIEREWWPAEAWDLDSNEGKVLVTNARGPWRGKYD